MKFKCINEKCNLVNIEFDVYNVKYITLGYKLAPNLFCNSCKKRLHEILNDIPISQKNISIGKFAGMTPQQRQQILKKRAHNHAKKVEKIDEIKRHKWTEAVDKFKKIP